MIEKEIINKIKNTYNSIKEYPEKIKIRSSVYSELRKKLFSRNPKIIYGILLEIDDSIKEDYKFIFKAKF